MTDLVKMLTEGETPETDGWLRNDADSLFRISKRLERRARALEEALRDALSGHAIYIERAREFLAAIDEQRKPR